MPSTRDIDWPRVIKDLEAFGLSRQGIGLRIGRSKTWVEHVRCGRHRQPRFAVGCRLLRLWADAMDKPMDKAPTREQRANG